MSKQSPAKSPMKHQGVQWWQQCIRNFITPYGAAQKMPPPEKIIDRLQPFTCEWLTRPHIALSEYSDTIISNLPILESDGNNMLDPAFITKLKSHFKPIASHLKVINKKGDAQASTPSHRDINKVLMSMLEDEDLDTLMEQMFQVSAAMFAISGNYMISSTLLRHPTEYSSKIDAKTKEGKVFQTSGKAKDMKNYILSYFQQMDTSGNSLSRKAPQSVRNVFIDSDDDVGEASSSSDSSATSSESNDVQLCQASQKKVKQQGPSSKPTTAQTTTEKSKRKRQITTFQPSTASVTQGVKSPENKKNSKTTKKMAQQIGDKLEAEICPTKKKKAKNA